jgi:hypothetical protein
MAPVNIASLRFEDGSPSNRNHYADLLIRCPVQAESRQRSARRGRDCPEGTQVGVCRCLRRTRPWTTRDAWRPSLVRVDGRYVILWMPCVHRWLIWRKILLGTEQLGLLVGGATDPGSRSMR